MSNININIGEFNCQDLSSPWALTVNMGTTYRVNNNDYELNYTWNSAMYDSIGLSTDVLLRFSLDGAPLQSYVGTLPDNATDFSVTFPPHDEILLQFEFQVGGGTFCYLYVSVPYSSIVSIT